MPKGVYKRTEKFLREQGERIRKNPPTLGKNWKLSKKTKKKMSLSKMGHPPFVYTSKIRKKMSESHKGEKSYTWKGGISIGKNKKEYYKVKCLERHSRKMKAQGSHTLDEWLTLKAQYNWTCPSCDKSEPKIKLSEDHIIPLSKGGSDNIENIQPLCVSCNCKKHTKIIKY